MQWTRWAVDDVVPPGTEVGAFDRAYVLLALVTSALRRRAVAARGGLTIHRQARRVPIPPLLSKAETVEAHPMQVRDALAGDRG